ncbi:hypothetical protein [Comamonas odontotermitis]|uniref:hypothetical protein n=1 Tax=Comamonas odontotermitis TaxID=379895 RepID=UPI0037505C50
MSTASTSTHVCTAGAIPTITGNDTWLRAADESRRHADVLRKHYDTVKKQPLRSSLWEGYWALLCDAEQCEKKAIQYGGLLHISVPAAVNQATAELKRRRVLA